MGAREPSSAGPPAPGCGGAVYVSGGTATIVNSTITANSAQAGTPGSPFGSPGTASGGGVGAANTLQLTLASDTITDNDVSAVLGGLTAGGNLFSGSAVPVSIASTIITGGTSSGQFANCLLSDPVTDGGFNLQSDTDSGTEECKLTATSSQHGVIPRLEALDDNGGPTQTLALKGDSPARGAGGPCTDPTTPGGALLATDQRGTARPAACDVGAFQGQLPTSTVKPAITGTAEVGQTLTCAAGTWTGDFVLIFSYQWLRDGQPIDGATSEFYKLVAADGDRKVACRVSASGHYANGSAESDPVTVPAPEHAVAVAGRDAVTRRVAVALARADAGAAHRRPEHPPPNGARTAQPPRPDRRRLHRRRGLHRTAVAPRRRPRLRPVEDRGPGRPHNPGHAAPQPRRGCPRPRRPPAPAIGHLLAHLHAERQAADQARAGG